MTLEKLYEELTARLPELAQNAFYDHIVIDEGEEIYPPFLFVHETDGTPFNADDHVYYLGIDNVIDLYQAERSPDLRRQICRFLDDLGIAYTLTLEEFDDETMLYIDRFTIELDE